MIYIILLYNKIYFYALLFFFASTSFLQTPVYRQVKTFSLFITEKKFTLTVTSKGDDEPNLNKHE